MFFCKNPNTYYENRLTLSGVMGIRTEVMRKILNFILIIPIAICILIIAVANRSLVTISLDPLSVVEPILSFKAPLFVFLFLALMLGLLVGGFTVWMTQGVHRKTARHLNKEISNLHKEALRLKSNVYDAPAVSTDIAQL